MHVREIFDPVNSSGHSRGQLQLDELRQDRKRMPSITTPACPGSGKATGLGLPSPGNSPAIRNSIRTPCSVSRRFLLPVNGGT